MNLLKNLNYLRDNHVIRLVEFIFDPLSYIEENFSNKVGERVVVVIEGKEKEMMKEEIIFLKSEG